MGEKPKETKKKKKDKIPEEGLFTEKELESLEKKIAEVERWRDEKVAEQDQLPTSQMPKLTVSLIKSKIQDLDGEVQFMISKARMIKAERERAKRKADEEEKKKRKAAAEETEEEQSTTKEDSPASPPVGTEEETTSDSSDKKPEDTDDIPEKMDEEEPNDSKDSDGEPEHSEL